MLIPGGAMIPQCDVMDVNIIRTQKDQKRMYGIAVSSANTDFTWINVSFFSISDSIPSCWEFVFKMKRI